MSEAGQRTVGSSVAVILVIWFVVALVSTVVGVFDWYGDSVVSAMLVLAYVLFPIVDFGLLYVCSARFRAFVLSLTLRTVVLVQTVRVIGGVFLILYLMGHLPGLFALPAGAGDVTIGVTAPIVAFVLLSRRPFPRQAFIAWNALGILDLVIAVTLGILCSPTPFGIFAGEISIRPLIRFPLGLIPTFGVPLTLILHLVALLQIKDGRVPLTAT